jgi:hypothetical protein
MAWIVVPAMVVVASAGIGYGVALVSGMDLRALTLPAGYLAGIAISTLLFYANIVGVATTVILVVLAVAGPLYAWRTGRGPRLPARGDRAGLVSGALAALAGYGAALAPIAGTGRSGVLGYVFNDDSAIHITLVQAISDGASGPVDVQHDSYHSTTRELGSGYPLGSYAWPVFGRIVGGIDPFHIWTPLCAVTLVMLTLVAFAMLRRLGAPAPYAAVAAVVIPCGHLVYAYHAQGGMKEVIMPVAVYAAAALFARALDEGISGRTLIPAALAAAASVANLGYAGAAWIGPMALAGAAIIGWGYVRGARIANMRNLILFAVVGLLLALPAGISSIRFFRNSEGDLTDPAEIGNLFDAVSLWQTLNVWLTGDYRFKPTDHPGFTYTALAIALVLAVFGLIHALRRRDAGVPLAVLAGIAGAWLISSRTSIYFDAKTYVVLAPALGIATAAGVLLLWKRWLALRFLGLAAAATVAVGVAWSASMIYAHVWVTPEERLGEYRTIVDRFEGRADVTLLADRDQYGIHLLRELGPWDDWGYRQPHRGFRFLDNHPPTPDRAPDLDDYTDDHVNRFDFLLERRSPGGSRAPSNYRPAFETEHYRMWERTGPPAREHMALGSDGQAGSAAVACRGTRPSSPAIRALVRRALKAGTPLVAAVQADPPTTVITPDMWLGLDNKRAVPAPEMVAGRGGGASGPARVAPGRYEAWIQGSFGPGVRLATHVPGRRPSRNVGDVYNDLGTPGWQRFGSVDVERGMVLQTGGIGRPRLLAGSSHFNIIGPTKLIRAGAATTIERIQPRDAARLCGRSVDWIELPPA